MKKKIFGLMLAVLVALPIFANAEEANVQKGDKTYATLAEAVADTESCEGICETVTTITVLKDSTTPGIIFESGKNLVIDFAGHTVNFVGPTVGSAGTGTNDMQILKDSNIVFQNGTIRSSQTEKSKVFIQNYANLTLKNMNILATNELNVYAVSINSGTVNIEGTTSIKTSAEALAIAAYGYYNGGYKGPQITIDTTGTIEGVIAIDCDDVDETTIKVDLIHMVIKNVNHKGEVRIVKPMLEDNLTIESGSYTDENVVENLPVEEGKEVYETYTPEGELEYIVATEEEIVEKATVYSFPSVKEFEEMLKAIEEDEQAPENIKKAYAEVGKLIANKNVAMAYDIFYEGYIGENYVIGSDKTELEKAVEVVLEIPEDLKELAKGYIRKYSVVRLHYNLDDDKYEVTELDATDNGDGTVSFESDKFSTYVLTYTDVKEELPAKTSDINLIMLIGGIALAIGGIIVSSKKRLTNNI